MRITIFTLSASLLFFSAQSQTICGTSDEGGTVTMTAPSGKVFTSIVFASYGTPNGTCGSFTVDGTCDASTSVSVVSSALIGQNSASVDANNSVFGDPCPGTFKRLYIEAGYGTLPLTLLSFTGAINNNEDLLKWQTADEINTKQFVIEKSTDGIHYSAIGTVAANNISGVHTYYFADNAVSADNQFYRLKMIDIDLHFTYSGIVRIANTLENHLMVFPSPASTSVTLSGLQSKGSVEIADMQGKIVQRVDVTAQSQTFNIASYPKGVYIIKYMYDQKVSVQKIVKQ
ncbi:MAG: T9SS type A sorting domain-containing protein [Bacteroidetes bacterium]|nr:T9SS type A sorting domain-containing protein [Bacteroidota bacterium]